MTDKTLQDFEGLYMPRKSFDVFATSQDVVGTTEITRNRLIENIIHRYEGAPGWEEMDRFWAQEDAIFLVKQEPYHEYLPGRYYTYDNLADVILSSIREEPKNAKIADIGCGSGICLVIQAMKGVRNVHGFDKSYGAINFFEDLAEHYKVRDRIQTKQGDFYSTGYDSGIFDATFNLGVFEHLSNDDQRRLMAEMVRITKPGGVVLVAIPNPESPLHRFSRDKELKFFGKLVDYIFPLRKYDYAVDLKALLKDNGIPVERESALLVAPPSEIPLNYLNAEARALYRRVPHMGRPKDVKELMKFWALMERSVATADELMKVGWYKYALGHKPG